MKKQIKEILQNGATLKQVCAENELFIESIIKVVDIFVSALKSGNKIVFFGNGGSAADSQHLAAELVGRLRLERDGLPAFALTANTSTITALANDFGYDKIFSRQIKGICRKGDVAFGISTSGSSKNVIEALLCANNMGVQTIALTGKAPNKMSELALATISIPSSNTQLIQELHISAGHIICELTENALAQK